MAMSSPQQHQQLCSPQLYSRSNPTFLGNLTCSCIRYHPLLSLSPFFFFPIYYHFRLSLSLLLYYSQFNTLSSHFISQQSIFAFHFVSKGLFGYRLLLKTKNWRHYSKIIFKCMNSVVGPSFKVIFAEFCTCGSHGQYTGPTKKKQPH